MPETQIVRLDDEASTDLASPFHYENDAKNPALVYLDELQSEGSRRVMTSALKTIVKVIGDSFEPRRKLNLKTVPWHNLRFAQVIHIRSQLTRPMERTRKDGTTETFTRKAGTVNTIMAALRGTLHAAWRLDLIDTDSYQHAINFKNLKANAPDRSQGRALSFKEIIAIFEACDDGTQRGIRDAAIFGVGYGCGLRRSEIVKLTLADCKGNKLTIREGKGNKTRVVPMPDGVQDALDDWLAVRGEQTGPLFCRMRKPDQLLAESLSAYAVQLILTRRAGQAGVEKLAPHDLRRTYAGDMLDAGADLSTVQKLMGHSDTKTTASYDRRAGRAGEAAAKRLHVPYKKRGKS